MASPRKFRQSLSTNTVLNVGGKDYNINMNGNESGFSNELVMPEKEGFWAVVEHPLAYDSACVMADRVWSGPLGDDDFGDREPRYPNHRGVDIRAVNEGKPCKVNTVAAGKVDISGIDPNGAVYVDINHQNGYATRYVHGKEKMIDPYNGDEYIYQGQFVFEMGCTGLCSGKHLHFELYGPKGILDPQDPAFFGYMGGIVDEYYWENIAKDDGNLYRKTKKY